MTTHDSGLGAILTLKETLTVSALTIGDPDGLLGIIGLEHVSPLHVHGDDEVWRWIGIRLTRLS